MNELKPPSVSDPLEIASQLAEGVMLLEQCRARSVVPSDDLLQYVDWLLEQVEELEHYGRFGAA